MKNKFSGIGVALVTPFSKDMAIDWKGFEKLLLHTATIGVDYWVVQGTTGESPATSKEEKQALLQFAKENNPQKFPIVYGMGGNYTQEVIKNIKETDLNGVDALLSVSPYYNKPTQKGIITHYTAIADNSPLPIILYNVPGRTMSNISANTTLELAKHSNIIGIKEASGNLTQCMEIAQKKENDFLLISGEDLHTPAMITFGAVGVISVLANAFQEFNLMVKKALENNFTESSEYLFKLLEINNLMYEEANPVGIKNALKHFGICEDFVRLPLLQASKELDERIKLKIQELSY